MNEQLGRRALLTRAGLVTAGAVTMAAAGSMTPAAAQEVGAAFFAIDPYRSFDTRQFVDGRLPVGFQFDVDLITDASGVPIVPAAATALTINLTITQTTGNGYLAVFPAGTDFPGVSTINWTGPNLTLANGATVRVAQSPVTDLPGSVTILCGGSPTASTHIIADVTGYFLEVVP